MVDISEMPSEFVSQLVASGYVALRLVAGCEVEIIDPDDFYIKPEPRYVGLCCSMEEATFTQSYKTDDAYSDVAKRRADELHRSLMSTKRSVAARLTIESKADIMARVGSAIPRPEPVMGIDPASDEPDVTAVGISSGHETFYRFSNGATNGYAMVLDMHRAAQVKARMQECKYDREQLENIGKSLGQVSALECFQEYTNKIEHRKARAERIHCIYSGIVHASNPYSFSSHWCIKEAVALEKRMTYANKYPLISEVFHAH